MHFITEFVNFVFCFMSLLALTLAIIHFIHIHPSQSDYFEVLSYTEWKTPQEIRSELEEKLKGKMIRIEVYYDLVKLTHDGLVEEEIIEKMVEGQIIKSYKYRKKTGRWKRKKIKEVKETPFNIEGLPA